LYSYNRKEVYVGSLQLIQGLRAISWWHTPVSPRTWPFEPLDPQPSTSRFGPVREVEKSLVLEAAFDAVQLSNRHKSGVAMRFPRLARIRTDKPSTEADRLETLMALIEDPTVPISPGADGPAGADDVVKQRG
jgi:hypothetical protein